MGFYAKKNLMGFKEVDESEADYYIQEIGEYRITTMEIEDLKAKLRKATKESSSAQRRQKESYEKEIAELEEQAELRIQEAQEKSDEMCGQLETVKEEVKRLEDMNADLKRIARERANQLRGITPKKEHDGYIVLRSEEWKEKWIEPASGKSKKTIRKEADVWKSVIQTPVDASIPLKEVEADMIKSIRSVLDEMGCGWCVKKGSMGYSESWKDSQKYPNVLYRWKFRADYKAGLWEADVYTTNSLVVPEHRRPPVLKRHKPA